MIMIYIYVVFIKIFISLSTTMFFFKQTTVVVSFLIVGYSVSVDLARNINLFLILFNSFSTLVIYIRVEIGKSA